MKVQKCPNKRAKNQRFPTGQLASVLKQMDCPAPKSNEMAAQQQSRPVKIVEKRFQEKSLHSKIEFRKPRFCRWQKQGRQLLDSRKLKEMSVEKGVDTRSNLVILFSVWREIVEKPRN